MERLPWPPNLQQTEHRGDCSGWGCAAVASQGMDRPPSPKRIPKYIAKQKKADMFLMETEFAVLLPFQ